MFIGAVCCKEARVLEHMPNDSRISYIWANKIHCGCRFLTINAKHRFNLTYPQEFK